MLGARGSSWVKRLLLGRISLAVAQRAPCPVLVVSGAPRAIRRVLVAAEGSPDALHVARAVASLGALRPVRVRVLGVEPVRVPATVPPAIYPRLRAAAIEWQGERRAKLAKALSTVARVLHGRGARVTVSVAEGVPAEAILAAARRARRVW